MSASPAPVLRHVTDVGGRGVAFRSGGDGPAVLVVGSIAHGSVQQRALLDELASTHRVMGVDPPGYGLSDAAGPEGVTIGSLARLVDAVHDQLGIERTCVVGVHSGALVALELARLRPNRYWMLVLDDVPVLPLAERNRLARHYAPDFPVCADGSHLLRHWGLRKGELLSFPWFDSSPDAAMNLDLTDPDVVGTFLAAGVLDQLQAGTDYPLPYLAALAYDPDEALREVPATVAVHALEPSAPGLGSPDAACAHAVPVVVGADRKLRRQAVVEVVRRSLGPPAPVAPAPRVRDRGRWLRAVASTAWGQVAAHRFIPVDDTAVPPVVMLHASPLSGASLLGLGRCLAEHGPVIVLDTLGYGDSDHGDAYRHPELRAPHMDDFARVALAALDDLGVVDFDLYGTHTGAVQAVEVAIAAPQRVRHLVLDGVPLFTPDVVQSSLDNYFPDLAPRWDGTHLVSAWSKVADLLRWYPWFRRDPQHRRSGVVPDPATMQDWLLQLLKAGVDYPSAHRAAFLHPTSGRLPQLTGRTAFCRDPTDPLAGDLEAGVALVPGADVIDMTGRPDTDAETIRAWLAGPPTADAPTAAHRLDPAPGG